MSRDYNATINLPKTDFPMRAGLPAREPGFLEDWYKNKVYEALMEKNQDKPRFILHDGPPYANGDIHMGHALNKILKDFIVRYKNMSGFQAPYVPGWDTHGLPIERQAIKAYGINRENVSVAEFRSKCEEFAKSHVAKQKEQFKRLGCIGTWDNPYLTLAPDFEAAQIRVFGEMAKQGYIYKGLKPVYWCPHDETALAEAEIEYADSKCDSIYVKFALTDDLGKISAKIGTSENVYFVIWTTTTWTLPGNVAISVNPNFEYDLVKTPSGEIFVLAKELVENVMKAANIDTWEVLATLLGDELELMKTKNPIMDRESLVIVGEHVTLEAGTGCVHTAPGFGADDFIVCQNYDVPILVPVDEKGHMNSDAGKYAGLYYEKSNKIIKADLIACGALLSAVEIDHSYPHCWRCKNPIIFRAAEQWFCSVEAMKDKAIAACKGVRWLPGWGEDRMTSMIRERNDWCISRQRIWGVPIPIFYCQDCGEPLINEESIEIVAKLFEKEGSNAWYSKEAAEIIGGKLACGKCGCKEFTKETDIMDVWFDSGSTHSAVLDARDDQSFPADVYLEGNDQYRGWFQSSLLTSIATKGVAPYKIVITHGMTVDEEAKKMSKSMGNGLSPHDVMKDYGADVLRLWVASQDYRQDMRMSSDMFKQLSQNYLKIRNTARYILGNLEAFDPTMDMVAFDDMESLDKWALAKLDELVARVTDCFENYEYHSVFHAIHKFCVVDMSNFYLDVIKDRLYCESTKGQKRRSAQTAMFAILDALVRMISPILVFTSDEIWLAMPHKAADDARGVLFNDMPTVDAKHKLNASDMEKWNLLISLRDDVNKALEKARGEKLIGKPLEAAIKIYTDEELGQKLMTCGEDIAALCIVSKATIVVGKGDGMTGEALPNITVDVARCEGEKCQRCWIFTETLGQNSEHPTLCARCAAVVEA